MTHALVWYAWIRVNNNTCKFNSTIISKPKKTISLVLILESYINEDIDRMEISLIKLTFNFKNVCYIFSTTLSWEIKGKQTRKR